MSDFPGLDSMKDRVSALETIISVVPLLESRILALESQIGTIDIPIPETITIETQPNGSKIIYRKE